MSPASSTSGARLWTTGSAAIPGEAECFALPDLAPVRQAAAVNGVVSHQSAAEHWKLECPSPPGPGHVTVRPGGRAGSPRKGLVVHYRGIRLVTTAAASPHRCER